jgi:hypothetical protein
MINGRIKMELREFQTLDSHVGLDYNAAAEKQNFRQGRYP